MFVTVRPNIVEAEWAAEEEKDEKKKKIRKKTSAETIRHLVLRTGCLINQIICGHSWDLQYEMLQLELHVHKYGNAYAFTYIQHDINISKC